MKIKSAQIQLLELPQNDNSYFTIYVYIFTYIVIRSICKVMYIESSI